MAQLNFNAAQVQPQQPFEPVPNDWYNVVIDESEVKPTSSGTGAYLELRLNIIDGAYANRKLFCRLNIQNDNAKTVEIAYQQLSAICHATQTIQVNDSSELHGKPFQVKVIVKPPQNGYDASNEFKGFKACDDGAGGASGGQTQGSGDPSWTNNNGQQQTNQQQQTQNNNQQQQSWNQGNAQNAVQTTVAQDQPQTTVQSQEQETVQTQNSNQQQSWDQNQGQQQQQADNTQATVEKTPEKDNGGNSKTAPWMQKK